MPGGGETEIAPAPGGLRPRPEGYSGARNFYEYLQTLKHDGAHGEAFAYKTVNTELLCWVMKRVTGIGNCSV